MRISLPIEKEFRNIVKTAKEFGDDPNTSFPSIPPVEEDPLTLAWYNVNLWSNGEQHVIRLCIHIVPGRDPEVFPRMNVTLTVPPIFRGQKMSLKVTRYLLDGVGDIVEKLEEMAGELRGWGDGSVFTFVSFPLDNIDRAVYLVMPIDFETETLRVSADHRIIREDVHQAQDHYLEMALHPQDE